MENVLEIVDDLHVEDLKSKVHPSFYDRNEAYDMLIVRVPVIAEVVDINSLGFIVTPSHAYFYNRTKAGFERLDEHYETMHQMIDPLTDKLLKRFKQYQDKIDEMEYHLYELNEHNDFSTHWLGLKRDISHIERVLLRSTSVIEEFIKYHKNKEDFPENHFLDILEHMHRVLRSSNFYLTKLDYLYNFQNTLTNEKMNRMIYGLTVISAIFLPLNLVVGFFGMNTSGLPFTSGATGTFYAMSTLIGFLLVSVGFVWYKQKRIR
jgi:magnesium transporter